MPNQLERSLDTTASLVDGLPTQNLEAADKLHAFLVSRHWRDRGLVGPDPGVRFNYRIGRFIKSVLRALPWRDSICYQQAQGYWALANWDLWQIHGDPAYREIAIQTSAIILACQRDDGAWEYPNREWKDRVATVEGIWACLALMQTYCETRDSDLMDGVAHWHRYFSKHIGFQDDNGMLAVNYFAGRPGVRVPNNSTDALRYLAMLHQITGDAAHLHTCTGILRFLNSVQTTSGEFPYAVPGVGRGKCRKHFQCFQYNAFQCLGLMDYLERTGDESARPPIQNVLRFLSSGVANDGHAFYECGNEYRRVAYHAAALGAAFGQASQLGFSGYESLAERLYRYVHSVQRPNGRIPYSRGDYRVLSDQRAYPRYLAMTLFHYVHPFRSLLLKSNSPNQREAAADRSCRS